MHVLTKEQLRNQLVTERNINKKLRHELEKSTRRLSECSSELNCMIDMKNAELEGGISSTDETPPDYFDAQTVHEAMAQYKVNCDLLVK